MKLGDEHQRNTVAAGNLDRSRFVEIAVVIKGNLNEGLFAEDRRRNAENDGTELGDDFVF